MNRLISAIVVTTTAFAIAAPMSASAMQIPQGQAQSAGLQTVDYKPAFRNHGRNNGNRMHGNRSGMWNGHRGYSEYRPGYRRHGNFWFPLAAFATGAVIGGALANQGSGGGSHEEICAQHYRSYRPSDNSWQPNNGPRQQCNY